MIEPRFEAFASFFCGLALLLAAAGAAADDEYRPNIAPASADAELAIGGFKRPDGIQVELFATEPLLANPVAFAFDERGRVFVCETFRQGRGVEDNRGHMVWLEDDLSLRTVEQRLEMFRKHLGDGIAEYARHHDRIRVLEDTDGDGKADRSTVFADGFNDVLDGTGAGVLIRKGDVFYTNIPHLWRLRDTDGDGKAEERTSLASGFGVRIAFRGHDMHGLVIGPDGRLYFSIGDRGYNVTTKEGKRLVRPETGAVFRCELDGSQLEVYAYGLRNPQELAFDDDGNLFTCDNNSDAGDYARWVQVVPGGDSGWRMHYQYFSDRGPWSRERMWYPYRSDDETTRFQPAYIVPPIDRMADGPSGLVAYPGVGLPDRYNGHFFLCDFRGTPARSGVRSFGLKAKGASFEIVDSHWFAESILATDVEFGYDGRLYVSDWIDGWTGEGKGRLYQFFAPAGVQRAKDLKIAEQFVKGFSSLDTPELVALLQHPDRRVRQEAQFELADRKDSATLLALLKNEAASEQSRQHAAWGLGQILRRTGDESLESQLVERLAAVTSARLQRPLTIILGEQGSRKALPQLVKLLKNGEAPVQVAAAIALGRIGDSSATPDLVDLLNRNADADPVLRHAGVMGLVGSTKAGPLVRLAVKSDSPSVRLAALLALRRLHSEEVRQCLLDSDPRIVEEAARAIHDEPIAAALPALAVLLDASQGHSDPLLRRALNANFRLGGPGHAAAVARFAAQENVSEALRKEAMFTLLHWDRPPVLDRVTNEHRPLPERSMNVARDAVRENFAKWLKGGDALRVDAVRLAVKYRLAEADETLQSVVHDSKQPDDVRAVALTGLGAIDSAAAPEGVKLALASSSPVLRAAAYEVLVQIDPDAAAARLDDVLIRSGVDRRERQTAVSLLAGCSHPACEAVLLRRLQQWQSDPGSIPAEIHLDLIEAARLRTEPVFRQNLQAWESSLAADDPLARFRVCLTGGDAGRGREVFFGSAAASCRRCHKIRGEGSDVGPDLSGVGLQPREFLLESMINPNAKIAKGFETAIFVMNDGRVQTGIVRDENDSRFLLVTAQGDLVTIPKADIDERTTGKSGMPEDVTKSLSPTEIRDLVEYLSTLKSPIKN